MIKVNSRKITLLVILLLILLVLGLLLGKLTTGYVSPYLSPDVKNEGEVTASGDRIIFTKGDTLSLQATTDNFVTGGTNLTSSSNPAVTLIASTETNNAEATYYIGFDINTNTYVYSTSNNTPEILLTIKDNSDTEITSISGLTYTTSGGVSGFDITNKKGLFDVAIDKIISTTSSTTGTTHTWTFTLTFVNLSTDQSINENANMNIDIIMQQKEPFATYIKSLYVSGSESTTGLYYHNGQYKDTDGTTVLDANDGSYRYAGASGSVNNYVCISDEETCSDANLFRIIGVIDGKVKLIKATSIGNKTWNDSGSNTWSSASLNTYLNNDYLSALGNFATNYIATSTWKVGGNTYANISQAVPATTYTNEIKSPAAKTTVSKKIGLMYVSDYGFAAVPAAWTTALYNYYDSVNGSTICSQDWLCLGSNEWLITPVSDNSSYAYDVTSSGDVDGSRGVTGSDGVRPVFYLESTVAYSGGSGSSVSPYRLLHLTSGDVSEEEIIVSPVVNGFTYSSTATTLNITADVTKGSSDISKYYFSIDEGSTYEESSTSTYTFSNLSVDTTYTVMIKAVDTLNTESEIYTSIAKTDTLSLSQYVISKYTGTQGTNGLYYHNSSLTNGAGDNSYRYAGANPSNYVCFGSSESTCPTTNLYRIIGVINNKVKLIKADYASNSLLGSNGDYVQSIAASDWDVTTYKGSNTSIGLYYWNNNENNTWSSSSLNTVNLNTNFINNIGSTWAELIDSTTWKVGGNVSDDFFAATANTVYTKEITSPAVSTTISKKIGLMYISDYAYGALPSAWTTSLENYDSDAITSNNWLYNGFAEWTITRASDTSDYAMDIYSTGSLEYTFVIADGEGIAVRPVFNLLSSVNYKKGTGISTDPIRIG